MKKEFLLVAVAFVVILSGCGLGDARQRLDASRANRDAAIQKYMSPDEAQDMLGYAHAHDSAFDQSLNTPSSVSPMPTPTSMPSYTGASCPACQQGIQRGQAYSQQQTKSLQTLQDSYIQAPPAPLGIGQGARGYNGNRHC